MTLRLFLSGIVLMIAVTLAAAPVLAATVSCPASCSCLLPAEAKTPGYPGFCGGKQVVCGYDALKNEKYCYERTVTKTTTMPFPVTAKPPVTVSPAKTTPATAPQLLFTTGLVVTTTPIPVTSAPILAGSARPVVTTLPGRVAFATRVSPVPADGTLPVITSRPPSDNAPPDVTGQASDGAPVPVSQGPADGPAPGITGKTTAPGPGGDFFSPLSTFFASLFGSSPPAPASSLQPVPCNGIMTSVMTDPQNCGSCGKVCSSGSCAGGQCSGETSRVTACGPLAIPCEGTCTYIRSDEDNCGSCGNACPAGGHCCAGSCTTLGTTENCGSCGDRCGSGEACCSGGCTDTSSDRMNCGSCGRPCPGTSVCENGVCVDRTCGEALLAERKAGAELRARLDLLEARYDEMEHRYNYCLWLTDFYKEGCLESLGDHCTTPPDPTEDIPFVTEYEP